MRFEGIYTPNEVNQVLGYIDLHRVRVQRA